MKNDNVRSLPPVTARASEAEDILKVRTQVLFTPSYAEIFWKEDFDGRRIANAMFANCGVPRPLRAGYCE